LYLWITSEGIWSTWARRGFKKFRVVGSNDEGNQKSWTEVYSINATEKYWNTKFDFVIPTEHVLYKYKYFRLIINQIWGDPPNYPGDVAHIGRWYLYGTQTQ
jgi:hypothetical protein